MLVLCWHRFKEPLSTDGCGSNMSATPYSFCCTEYEVHGMHAGAAAGFDEPGMHAGAAGRIQGFLGFLICLLNSPDQSL